MKLCSILWASRVRLDERIYVFIISWYLIKLRSCNYDHSRQRTHNFKVLFFESLIIVAKDLSTKINEGRAIPWIWQALPSSKVIDFLCHGKIPVLFFVYFDLLTIFCFLYILWAPYGTFMVFFPWGPFPVDLDTQKPREPFYVDSFPVRELLYRLFWPPNGTFPSYLRS